MRARQPQVRLHVAAVQLKGAAAPVHRGAGAARRQAHRRNVEVYQDAVGIDLRLVTQCNMTSAEPRAGKCKLKVERQQVHQRPCRLHKLLGRRDLYAECHVMCDS